MAENIDSNNNAGNCTVYCKNEKRITALEERLDNHMEANRIECANIREKISNINETVVRNDANYANIVSLLNEMRRDLSDLKAKGSKRWETVVTAIIVSGVGAVVGYLIGTLAK